MTNADFTLAHLWVSNYCCLAFGAPPMHWTEEQKAMAYKYKLLIEAYTKWLNDPQEQELVKKHLK